MGGLDRLISTSLTKELKKGLKLDVLKAIERELFLEHGMSIKLSIEHFEKFSNVLKKNTQINVSKFEKDCINKIIKVKKKNENFLITIKNQELSNLILESFSDVETRKIISTLLENELTIPKILKESKVPKTSGYRKIENMILNGIIIESVHFKQAKALLDLAKN